MNFMPSLLNAIFGRYVSGIFWMRSGKLAVEKNKKVRSPAVMKAGSKSLTCGSSLITFAGSHVLPLSLLIEPIIIWSTEPSKGPLNQTAITRLSPSEVTLAA